MKRIKELSKALTESQEKPENKVMYGKVISADTNGVIVQIDGADIEIPVNSTVEVNVDDRVMIQFNDHEASIIGNVFDKSITRTTADGLIDVYANNGTFSGTLSAPLGNIGGWSLSSSAIYRTSSSFGDANGMYFGSNGLSIKDKFKVSSAGALTAKNATFYGANDDYTVKLSDMMSLERIESSVEYKTRIYPALIRFTRSDVNDDASIYYVNSNGTGILSVMDVDFRVYNNLLVGGAITAGGAITMPVSKSLKGENTSGVAKSLIYMTAGNNVKINGDESGITQIATDTSVTGGLTATGDIKSTGGKLIANNCTAWNGGVAGGLINENGTAVLVGPDANNLPRIVFVRAKSTTQYSILRALNSSGTYTLTLPNATGTLAVSSSDIRLKENIKDSEVSGLELIEKIKLHEFDWKPEAREGAPHWKIGMSADELEELDENLTFGGGENEDGTMNVKGIETTCLISYLVKAVQELSQEIQELKQRGG
jgi:hypothetical protein